MPRPRGPKVQEKSKDFKGSMIRLIKNLKQWKVIMVVALALAMISAILSLIAPKKLSSFADTISEGLIPKTDKIAEISNLIQNNFSNETIVVDNVEIPYSDQLEYIKLTSQMNNSNYQEILDSMPSSIYMIIKPSIDMNKIKTIATFMACLYIISALFNYVESYSLTTVSNRFANSMRSRISKKINKLPLKYFDNHEIGDVLSRITNDVDIVAFNLNDSLVTLVTSGTLFMGSLLMMFITNPIMAITAILSSALGFVLMFSILGKSQKYFNQRQEQLGDINGYIEEMYSGHNVVKVYNATEDTLEEFNKLNEKLYTSSCKSEFWSRTMHPIMGLVGNMGYVSVCIVGALLTMKGIISFGVIVAFMIYVRMFTNPLSQIAQAMASLQSTAAASERVFEFLDEKELSNQKEIRKTLHSSNAKGEIEFKNVKFGYDFGKPIIKDFSVKVKPGQKIAIVGPTGAGKTTMVNLLMKFYEINSGQIIIDGIPTSDLSRENIHDLFIMVLQDTWLFEGTIADNIRFNKENVTDREIWDALKTVGVHHFVRTLPGGLDYVIGDSDAISQGQKQLLTIARGMVKDAPFLILDEATSSVDTRTEELVQKAMDKLTEGRTSFIIAHRLSTIKNADLILVMKDGNIIEQGTHNELMKQHGFYKDLYNSQFEKTK